MLKICVTKDGVLTIKLGDWFGRFCAIKTLLHPYGYIRIDCDYMETGIDHDDLPW